MNLGLNDVLIALLGVSGAALATMLSHLLQLIMHHIYASRILGKEEYPHSLRLWGGYALCFLAAFSASYLFVDIWLCRWGIGAVLGLWELYRIRKRRSLL